jgi:hypothetical protein
MYIQLSTILVASLCYTTSAPVSTKSVAAITALTLTVTNAFAPQIRPASLVPPRNKQSIVKPSLWALAASKENNPQPYNPIKSALDEYLTDFDDDARYFLFHLVSFFPDEKLENVEMFIKAEMENRFIGMLDPLGLAGGREVEIEGVLKREKRLVDMFFIGERGEREIKGGSQ